MGCDGQGPGNTNIANTTYQIENKQIESSPNRSQRLSERSTGSAARLEEHALTRSAAQRAAIRTAPWGVGTGDYPHATEVARATLDRSLLHRPRRGRFGRGRCNCGVCAGDRECAALGVQDLTNPANGGGGQSDVRGAKRRVRSSTSSWSSALGRTPASSASRNGTASEAGAVGEIRGCQARVDQAHDA